MNIFVMPCQIIILISKFGWASSTLSFVLLMSWTISKSSFNMLFEKKKKNVVCQNHFLWVIFYHNYFPHLYWQDHLHQVPLALYLYSSNSTTVNILTSSYFFQNSIFTADSNFTFSFVNFSTLLHFIFVG